MPTETVTVDMTGCPCCEQECCCEEDPPCLMASIVGTGDCECITADIVLEDGGGSFFYEYACGSGDLRQFDIQFFRTPLPTCTYQMNLSDGAAMNCSGLACADTCGPFVVEFVFTVDVFESGSDCNESSCAGTLTLTITEAECP